MAVPYVLLAVAAFFCLFGVAKVTRAARPYGTAPWGSLLLWAVLFGAGVTVWFMSARIY